MHNQLSIHEWTLPIKMTTESPIHRYLFSTQMVPEAKQQLVVDIYFVLFYLKNKTKFRSSSSAATQIWLWCQNNDNV